MTPTRSRCESRTSGVVQVSISIRQASSRKLTNDSNQLTGTSICSLNLGKVTRKMYFRLPKCHDVNSNAAFNGALGNKS